MLNPIPHPLTHESSTSSTHAQPGKVEPPACPKQQDFGSGGEVVVEGFYDHPLAEHCGPELPRDTQPDAATGGLCVFLELFAEDGVLTEAVAKVMAVEPPQDFDTGGVDFSDLVAVKSLLWRRWKDLADSGTSLFFHVAPPCASFSRARDRAWRTRLRTPAQPEGMYPTDSRTIQGNLIATNTALSVVYLVRELGGAWFMGAASRQLHDPVPREGRFAGGS